jgi:hypothetical protein
MNSRGPGCDDIAKDVGGVLAAEALFAGNSVLQMRKATTPEVIEALAVCLSDLAQSQACHNGTALTIVGAH